MRLTMFLLPAVLGFTALACQGTAERMQILDQPVYVCPTAIPQATDLPAPTRIQPPIVTPPSGWATMTPFPGCIWDGRVCATNTPYPGGLYSTPSYTAPGATSTPRPTTTPYPTPTPFVLRPPQNFYLGDAIYTGGFASPVNVRLRLLDVHTQAASPALDNQPRSLVRWQLEVKNVGSRPYELFPAWQMYVSTVDTAVGPVDGIWGTNRDAVTTAGLMTTLEAITLRPGETRVFALAAFIPEGTPQRFSYALDPTTDPSHSGVPGANVMTWVNEPNTVCAGDLAEPPLLPTPMP